MSEYQTADEIAKQVTSKARKRKKEDLVPKARPTVGGISNANPFWPYIENILNDMILPVLLGIIKESKTPIESKKALYKAYVLKTAHKPSFPVFLKWLSYLKISFKAQLVMPNATIQTPNSDDFDNAHRLRPMVPAPRPTSAPVTSGFLTTRVETPVVAEEGMFDNIRNPKAVASPADLELRDLLQG